MDVDRLIGKAVGFEKNAVAGFVSEVVISRQRCATRLLAIKRRPATGNVTAYRCAAAPAKFGIRFVGFTTDGAAVLFIQTLTTLGAEERVMVSDRIVATVAEHVGKDALC